MSALTLRLPDQKHERLRAMAAVQGISIAGLLDELTTQALAEFDAETRFKIRQTQGANRLERGLALLSKAQDAAA